MHHMRKWMTTWLGASLGVAVAVLFLAMLTVGHAAEPKVKGKALEEPSQGKQLCPSTPGSAACQLKIECPPIKAPGETTCKATIHCPGPQKQVKPKKKSKSP